MRVEALLLGEAQIDVPEAKPEGRIRPIWVDDRGRIVLKGFDFGSNAQGMVDQNPAILHFNKEIDLPSLAAPGESAPKNIDLLSAYGFIFTVATIDTNVIVRLEITDDESEWPIATLQNTAVPNAAIATNQMTITANGSYLIWTTDPAHQVRLDWVSEAGGVAATIGIDWFGRRA